MTRTKDITRMLVEAVSSKTPAEPNWWDAIVIEARARNVTEAALICEVIWPLVKTLRDARVALDKCRYAFNWAGPERLLDYDEVEARDAAHATIAKIDRIIGEQ